MLTLSYLPKCTEFLIDFRKQEPVSNCRLNRFLCRGGLTGKFYPDRFLITRFLLAGFYCILPQFFFLTAQFTSIFYPDVFPKDQYFIVFEFSNGGRDLEGFEFGAMAEAWSVLHQTALGLAVAENALEFEHRDLHWGNVLISRTEDEFIESCLLGERKTVPTHGVRVSLIDFTLSRLKKGNKTLFMLNLKLRPSDH